MIKKSAYLWLILVLLLGCETAVYNPVIVLKKDPNYPRWLSAGGFNADQTSGITFLKETPGGKKYFLLAISLSWPMLAQTSV